ncbi:Protein kinase-like domain [Pseudocohnilembus persalinus]|uniref:Protein kinase-like domain n=1 Tax=Pseudocohnilembus persalinus TaxID=266149 RepID=A0A0V0R974_PSEPJ|nr:Protein kinase-like domain [Pseudocohnilembus persalinus]|eukprot:KRX10994.1 Protein kinase-like domain [Pseudocohnilembus persalinus]
MEDHENIQEITQEEIKKKYNILYRIGEGGFGSVYKAFSTEKNQIVALKEQKCQYNELEENIKIEKQILQYQHINIIEYYEIFYIFDPFFQNYHLYVSMEYCDYDLLKLISLQIEKKEPLSQQEQLNFYLQILQALHFLHSKKITHGDLKPENILIKKDENGKRTIKLSDFGTIKNQKTLKTVTKHSSIQGTYIYLPKEVFENEKVNYFKVDAFCFGLTVLLMCGTPFIKFQDIQDIQKNDKSTFKTLINEKLTGKGIQLFEILHIMLEQDYKKRSDILNSYETIVQFIKKKIGEIQFNKLILLSYKEKENKVIVKLDFGNGDLYEGEILDNMRNGYGKQIWKNGAVYEGNWLNNNKHGQGIYKNKEGDYYEGSWFKNKKQGHGILISKRNDIFYEGSWVNDMQHGYGKYKNQNGEIYEGNWIDNKLTGQGKIFKKNGDIWEVNFQNNKVDGNVKITFKLGIIYEGDKDLNSNHLNSGKLLFPSGVLFQGDFYTQKNGLWENPKKEILSVFEIELH